MTAPPGQVEPYLLLQHYMLHQSAIYYQSNYEVHRTSFSCCGVQTNSGSTWSGRRIPCQPCGLFSEGVGSRDSPVGCLPKVKTGGDVMNKRARVSRDYCEFDRAERDQLERSGEGVVGGAVNRVGRIQSPSHTTGRAVRHPAVQFNCKACWFM